MKCLFGIYKMDAGKILFDEKERRFNSAADAMAAGVSMIHQELSNVPERSVAQNLWLGREPRNTLRLIDHKKMHGDTKTLLEGLNYHFDPNARMASLSISQQQGCEIARAVSYNASIVVMDEPTSSLTENEVSHLFEIIGERGGDHIYQPQNGRDIQNRGRYHGDEGREGHWHLSGA